MPSLQALIMERLYKEDIWIGFEPDPSSELQGWNGDHPSLSKITALPNAALVVDIGVWKGQSTINMALTMKNRGINGCVIAVDTFLGSPEHWSAGLFTRHNGMPDLYRTFMSNAHKAGVSDYVVPMAQTSITAAHILRTNHVHPNLVHVDAAHEYEEALRDVEEYYALLAPGGYLVGDDYIETWPGVIRAAGEFSAKTLRPLTIEWPKWTIQKPANA